MKLLFYRKTVSDVKPLAILNFWRSILKISVEIIKCIDMKTFSSSKNYFRVLQTQWRTIEEFDYLQLFYQFYINV